MIISASYKTDIPAFYGDWFEHRLTEGHVDVRNPFNNSNYPVSLKKADVEGFVFWTRNLAPFENRLKRLIAGHFPFYVQFTITGYPTALEPSVIPLEQSVAQIKKLVADFGQHAVIWRYDPVLISTHTPLDFHRRTFAFLSRELEGSVNEVVVSFTQFYRKTTLNLKALQKARGIYSEDPDLEVKQDLLREFRDIAFHNGQKLTLCTQPHLTSLDISGAACIDAERLGLAPQKSKGNRPGCLCAASRDIGAYDTCIHGCAYCYAVSKPKKAKAVYHRHSPLNSSLT
ncbi:MAG: DUF1848 domain-containing protein [Sneathiellales bacterium]|nr:DUF1848 domain-containing protein [Sneathiellales bacterium]